MKFRKLAILWLAILFILASTAGCEMAGSSYSFSQSIENVKKVEICSYDYAQKTVTPIKELTTEEAEGILEDIAALECYKHFGDSTRDYGEVVIYITYENDEAEVIGIWNVAQVDLEGEWHIGIEYFDRTAFCEMLGKYIDMDLLPEIR